MHGPPRAEESDWYMALAGRRLLNHAAVVHSTAAAELEQAKKWFDNDRTIVLPLVFDLAELRELPGPESAGRASNRCAAGIQKCCFSAACIPRRELSCCWRRRRCLHKKGTPLQVIIAGDGEPCYLTLLRRHVQELGLGQSVSFLGMVKGPLKLSVYQAADLFVLPTSQENFGLVLPESLACGTPIITTRGVDIWQEIQAGGAVIVDRTPQAFAEQIARLLADAPLRQELSRRGRQWVLETFDPQKTAEQYERVYSRVAARGG